MQSEMNRNNKVIVEIMGGLGNQLFQYAAARALSLKLNSLLVIDLSWFYGDYGRNFCLDGFNLPVIYSNRYQILPFGVGRFVRRILKELLRKRSGASIYEEPHFHHDDNFRNIEGSVYLSGYFQSPKYFLGFDDQIRADLKFPSDYPEKLEPILRRIKESDAIAIHIRRGDYLASKKNIDIYHTQSNQYYLEAVGILSKCLKNPFCFIFSDDSTWVKNNLNFNIPYEIVDVNSPDEPFWDMMLMSQCKYFAIANSSFSWWAAWLCDYPKKIVIAPKKWFKSDKGIQDLLPIEWVKL
jgi:hypothetical protein